MVYVWELMDVCIYEIYSERYLVLHFHKNRNVIQLQNNLLFSATMLSRVCSKNPAIIKYNNNNNNNNNNVNYNWVVTRLQWLFYIYTKYEIGY